MRNRSQTAAKEREQFVAMSNDLIRNGKYDLTTQQLKIILYIISKICPNDTIDTWYTIYIRDLCRCCGIAKVDETGTYYKRLKADLKKLTWRKWAQKPDSDTEYSISWIGDVMISKGSGEIKVIFNPMMEPFLFQLKEKYTQYELQKILTFISKYSIRLYMLLKSYIYESKLKRNTPQTVTLDVDYLRFALSCDTKGYAEWRDFNKRVLRVAVDEINEKSDEFHIEMEPVTGHINNKIEKVKFTLTAASAEQSERAKEIRQKQLDRK